MSNVLGGSYRPSIHSSIFNVSTSNTTYQATGPRGFERLMQAVSPNAFHNSDDRPDPPKCHENTRVAVINKIMDWVTGKIDTDALMLWLYGPAGAGKSAIARTIAELCEAQGLLLASFLFFRSDPKRNTMAPLVANIVYCVACVIPGARERINTVIEADPLILSYSVEAQLTKLVLEPLRLLAEQGNFSHMSLPPLVIIDGLDECLDEGAQTNLIRLLSSSAARYQLPLKFLIASRPEAHIKSAFGLASDRSTVSYLELNNDFEPDKDIRCFLTDKFREIQRCHPLRSQIPSLWPSEEEMDTLVRKASGQFIYASLTARFIHSACDLPTRQLDIVLGLRPPIHNDLPFSELDALYSFILSRAKNIHLVLCILCVDAALKQSSVGRVDVSEAVLGLEDGDIPIYLSALSSLLEIKEADHGRWDTIAFYHSSFMDFLQTQERSKDYYVDSQEGHTIIIQRVLQTFTSNASHVSQQETVECLRHVGLPIQLEHTILTSELEHALEKFSVGHYIYPEESKSEEWMFRKMETQHFFKFLEVKAKHELYSHHCVLFQEYVNSSIESHPSREKFHLLSTFLFTWQKPWKSYKSRLGHYRIKLLPKWPTALFGLDSSDRDWDLQHFGLTCGLDSAFNSEEASCKHFGPLYGHIAETKRLVPQPILSHRLAHVAISCMQYLRHRGPNTPPTRNHLRAWAMKSKRFPWIWRRRMQVTSARRGTKDIFEDKWTLYSLSQSLRRPRQKLHSMGIQSEEFYYEAHMMYMLTLDLLWRTLRKARKSDELIETLKKPFIYSPAHFLFPRRVKRVRTAIDAYLEKVGEITKEAGKVVCEDLDCVNDVLEREYVLDELD